ncbi:tetratricopeptide repeat protein [Vibrio cholerae]
MSAINNALTQLTDKTSGANETMQRAVVAPVKQVRVLPWVVGSFFLSLAVGGFALSQQETAISQMTNKQNAPLSNATPVPSPTAKLTSSAQAVYVAPETKSAPSPQHASSPSRAPSSTVVDKPAVEKPVLVAKVATPLTFTEVQEEIVSNTSRTHSVGGTASNSTVSNSTVSKGNESSGSMVVEHVELTPAQLAEKAQARGQKALESNNLKEALEHYHQALNYTPEDIEIRKRLAALYYGKGEVRKSVDMLQKGISLDKENNELRIALATLLIKEQQNTAALTAVAYLPRQASVEYLSLRAALAQKQQQNALAKESYQALTEREPDSGRWWLGLAIAKERAFELDGAQQAYQQALSNLGLSSQSQQFARDRLAIIAQLQEPAREN